MGQNVGAQPPHIPTLIVALIAIVLLLVLYHLLFR